MQTIRGVALIGLASAMLILASCGKSSPTSPTPSVPDVSGTWDAMFIGTIVQRNDGGPLGARQTDNFVLSIQQSGTSLSGSLIYGEGRAGELRLPLTATLTGARLEYRVDTNIGVCSLTIRADTALAAAADAFTGTQTQANCEGRAEGTVSGNKRR